MQRKLPPRHGQAESVRRAIRYRSWGSHRVLVYWRKTRTVRRDSCATEVTMSFTAELAGRTTADRALRAATGSRRKRPAATSHADAGDEQIQPQREQAFTLANGSSPAPPAGAYELALGSAWRRFRASRNRSRKRRRYVRMALSTRWTVFRRMRGNSFCIRGYAGSNSRGLHGFRR